MTALLLLLFSAGVLLSSTGAQETYNALPDNYRQGVDLAVEQLHHLPSVKHHFRFFKSLLKSDIEAGFRVKYLYHNFYLKPTKCARNTANPDPQSCPFRNDRPLMDCVVCYKTYEDKIEKEPRPYIHCLHKPAVTQDLKTTRVNLCQKMSYSSGAPTLLAVSRDETE